MTGKSSLEPQMKPLSSRVSVGGDRAWSVEGAALEHVGLVGVVRDEEGLAGCSPCLTTWGVLSLAGKAVGQGSLDVFFLGSLQVLLLSTPGLQGRGLQGSAIRESQGPRLQQGALVMALRLMDASSSLWPPDRKVIPGTAGGTVRRSAVTVAMAISS